MIPLGLVWIVGSVIIAYFGRHLRFGFWGYFFASILLTPIIGLLLLIAAIPPRKSGKPMRS